jgi:hypothetical protein
VAHGVHQRKRLSTRRIVVSVGHRDTDSVEHGHPDSGASEGEPREPRQAPCSNSRHAPAAPLRSRGTSRRDEGRDSRARTGAQSGTYAVGAVAGSDSVECKRGDPGSCLGESRERRRVRTATTASTTTPAAASRPIRPRLAPSARGDAIHRGGPGTLHSRSAADAMDAGSGHATQQPTVQPGPWSRMRVWTVSQP